MGPFQQIYHFDQFFAILVGSVMSVPAKPSFDRSESNLNFTFIFPIIDPNYLSLAGKWEMSG